jgi:(2S)-methylsuccinyl-CoA dehydrogenase
MSTRATYTKGAPSVSQTLDLRSAVDALDSLYQRALPRVLEQVSGGGKLDRKRLAARQLAGHALAYLATEVEATRQLVGWLERVRASGNTGNLEERITAAYVGEVIREVAGGVNLGACESIALEELGLTAKDVAETVGQPSLDPVRAAASGDAVCEIARLAHELGGYGEWGLDDEMLDTIRSEFRKFTDNEVVPIAQDVHRKDVLIPMSLIDKMNEMGVFGLTIPEEYGGQGLGKVAMCIVTEELSRGYIGVGSLGTRSEIAGELILGGGTEAQKKEWLPKLASGEVMSTAVFTEPNNGSDLAHIRTKATRQPDGSWVIDGSKTWITHATRADLMTLLARTNPNDDGHAGVSMFLATKSRGSEESPETEGFPDAGIDGTEIKVLGYRGMKEFEMGFDGYQIPGDALLGGQEGQGFRQLMVTFEGARIQTAARGVGIAQAALEEGMRYANERIQFGVPIFSFPRVQRKLGRMIVRIMASRQLAFYAARQKDTGKRCDLEAGMAKLLGTKAAWESADACVQIHGGNGYAEEYIASRLLVDARVLSIFEGANEIQADVIARRLLEQGLGKG